MKKLIIGMTAIVGLGLGFVNAAEMKVDFDKGSFRVVGFMEAIKNVEKHTGGDVAAVPAPTPVKVGVFDTKGEEDAINRSIKTAIQDCEKKGYVVLKTKFEKLLAEGIL